MEEGGGGIDEVFKKLKIVVQNYAPINVKPDGGGGGTPGICGAFDYLCYLHPRVFD